MSFREKLEAIETDNPAMLKRARVVSSEMRLEDVDSFILCMRAIQNIRTSWAGAMAE